MTAAQAIEWLKTKPQEMPVFVLLGSDPLAAETVRTWIDLAYGADVVTAKRGTAAVVAGELDAWPEKRLPH